MSLQGYPWPLCFPYLRDFADDEYPEYGEEEEEGGKEKEQGCIYCPKCWGNSGGYEEEDYEDLYLAYLDPWFEMGWPWGFWGVNVKGMAERFGVRKIFVLRLGGPCVSWCSGESGWAVWC